MNTTSVTNVIVDKIETQFVEYVGLMTSELYQNLYDQNLKDNEFIGYINSTFQTYQDYFGIFQTEILKYQEELKQARTIESNIQSVSNIKAENERLIKKLQDERNNYQQSTSELQETLSRKIQELDRIKSELTIAKQLQTKAEQQQQQTKTTTESFSLFTQDNYKDVLVPAVWYLAQGQSSNATNVDFYAMMLEKSKEYGSSVPIISLLSILMNLVPLQENSTIEFLSKAWKEKNAHTGNFFAIIWALYSNKLFELQKKLYDGQDPKINPTYFNLALKISRKILYSDQNLNQELQRTFISIYQKGLSIPQSI